MPTGALLTADIGEGRVTMEVLAVKKTQKHATKTQEAKMSTMLMNWVRTPGAWEHAKFVGTGFMLDARPTSSPYRKALQWVALK